MFFLLIICLLVLLSSENHNSYAKVVYTVMIGTKYTSHSLPPDSVVRALVDLCLVFFV